MAITDKEKGVWGLDQVYNKINQGSIWEYSAPNALWSWGTDGANLGLNDTPARSSPTQIPGTTWNTTNIGPQPRYGRLWIKTDGTLWAWGKNQSGILGQNQQENDANNIYSSPIQIPGTTWKQVSGGAKSAWAVKTDGTLWAWGSNSYGGLGINQPASPTNRNDRSSPTQIPGTSWDSVGVLGFGGAAIRTDGTLWVWGLNQNGQIGDNTAASPGDPWTGISSPKQIPGTTWKSVLGNFTTTLATKTDGTLWMWGNNYGGVLGQNNQTKYSSPTQIPGTTWSFVRFGGSSSLGTKTDGTLWAWGGNATGGLGQNSRTYYSSPVQIPGTTWKTIDWGVSTRGGEHAGTDGISAGIKTDGTLWAWGRNSDGTSGDNSTIQRSSPTQVLGGDYLTVEFGSEGNSAYATSLQ